MSQWENNAPPSTVEYLPDQRGDDLLPIQPTQRSRRHWTTKRNAIASAAAVALMGAGVATSLSLSGSSSGAPTPVAAVRDLYTSLEDSDVLGVLDILAPGERNAIEPGVESIVSQLQRLGLVSSGARLGDISGLSVRFSSLDITAQPLSPHVAAVSVAPTSETDTVDPSQLPLGPFVSELEQQLGTGQGVQSTTTSQDSKSVLGTVELDGSWYVSLGYTIAINDLTDEGRDPAPPPVSQALTPFGATSPSGAVQDLFNAMANLDIGSMAASLDPEEMAALDAYSPYWLPAAQDSLENLGAKFTLTFGNLDLITQQVSDGTLVKVGPGFSFTLSSGQLELSYANGCGTLVGPGPTPQHFCHDQITDNSSLKELLADMPPDVASIARRVMGAQADIGFVTVQENGLWYVSPVRTLCQYIVGYLQLLQPSDLTTILAKRDAIVAAFRQFEQQEEQGPSGSTTNPLASLVPLEPA